MSAMVCSAPSAVPATHRRLEQFDVSTLVVELRVRLNCPALRLHIGLDEVSEFISLSGDWRSGKSHLGVQ